MPEDIDLCSRDDVRIALEIQAGKTTRDALIDDAITDASQRIIDYCEREFAPESAAATVRTFPVVRPASGYYNGVFVDLNPYDLQAATAVVLNPAGTPTTLTVSTDYELRPSPSKWGVYYRILLSRSVAATCQAHLGTWTTWGSSLATPQLQITGTWGFPEVPRAVRRACIVTVASWIDRRVGAYSAQDASDGRTVMPDTTGGLDIPNSAKRMLEPFKRAMNA